MKEVMAIIRPEKWRATAETLRALGIEDVIQRRVLGRGRQAGLRYLSNTKEPGRIRYLPKRMLSFVVPDGQVGHAVRAVMAVNKTGVIGDGKIFVCPGDVPAETSAGDRGSEAASDRA